MASERKASRGRRETASKATEQRQSAEICSVYCSVTLLLSASARSVENGTAEMDPDEQTESDEDSEDIISNDGGELMNDGTHNGGAETVTDVFKDARRLFP
jgi:hypothetical protein